MLENTTLQRLQEMEKNVNEKLERSKDIVRELDIQLALNKLKTEQLQRRIDILISKEI